MPLEPWYKLVTPRKEVREGRSFNPDEFAIALEQVVAGTAPEDYRDPARFFARTCFTRALGEHVGMVLRRLAGETANTAPVVTLVTQFGGGKTHTLATLYHLVRSGKQAVKFQGVATLLDTAGLKEVPKAKVGVFVGNAWDPREGRETPWLDLAQQIAGETGVAALGASAKRIPPGTESIGRLFEAAGGPVLILFDEVLNFVNRHRNMAEPFHSFIQNLTVATTGRMCTAAVVSLPRSQVEMTDFDLQWQEKITKIVRRVAKDLISNDEAEISEVVRRRLFEDLGDAKARKGVAKAYADWCFEHRAELPPEWTAVDTAATEAKAREYLEGRFQACYPFHPATLSVFQRKWQALPQYQQTRGTLAMLAQWISWAQRDGYANARREPLITLGSAPLDVSDFCGVVLGQLGEPRLGAALDADIAGPQSHARALDADTKGNLRHIHRRVGAAILFESSGGQIERVAQLPELRFALGEPDVDTTSVDSAAMALESKAFFIRRVGASGFQVRYQPTLKKVVSDRRAALDEESEIRPAMEGLVKAEFERGRSLPTIYFPVESGDVQDSPRLTLVVMNPGTEWSGSGALRMQIAEWTRQRGSSPRLYPASLIWCLKKQGREVRERVENWLAWRRVKQEIDSGTLGGEFDRAERIELQAKVSGVEEAAKDEVWASYRYVVLADGQAEDGIQVIDLGAGHSSGAETLSGRVSQALRSHELLSTSVGAGYLQRHWPVALKESGAWSITGLRQSFLNGSLTRLADPDTVLREKVVEFVRNGDFGLASGQKADGSYERVWFKEQVSPAEVAFEPGVFLLTQPRAQALRRSAEPGTAGPVLPVEPKAASQPGGGVVGPGVQTDLGGELGGPVAGGTRTIHLAGTLPPEVWNRLGTKLLPKLRAGTEVRVGVDFTVTVGGEAAGVLIAEIRQILDDLGLGDRLRIE